MTSGLFKQHFDMISMNEPIQRKARFWTSYVGSLKGSQDIRADDSRRTRLRPVSDNFSDLYAAPMHRLFDDSHSQYADDAHSRVQAPGYRYQPVSRETYGYSPRLISTPPSSASARYNASRK